MTPTTLRRLLLLENSCCWSLGTPLTDLAMVAGRGKAAGRSGDSKRTFLLLTKSTSSTPAAKKEVRDGTMFPQQHVCSMRSVSDSRSQRGAWRLARKSVF